MRLLEDLPALDLLRGCEALGKFWNLGPDVMAELLGISRTTWHRWRSQLEAGQAPRWNRDQRARAVALLQIFEAVGDLNQNDADLAAWPNEPLRGPAFEGRRPLEVMRSSFEGLLLVRDYLRYLLGR